ncbi:MAG: LuxR family transcriptional regulator [Pseudomonadota bacterium]
MSRQQGFNGLLKELQKKNNNTDSLFRKIQSQYDICHQAYVSFSLTAGRQNALDLLHSFPLEFVNLYRQKNLISIDPVMQSALTGVTPVDWRERHLSDPATGPIFTIASDFGISDVGMTIPLLSRGNQTALFVLNADIAPEKWAKRRIEVLRDVQVLATYLHAARQEKAQAFEPAELTARESEVLTWTAAGKSYWEIAMILGISERTVRFFMTNARRKLGVVTNPQAVAQAVWRGIIPL